MKNIAGVACNRILCFTFTLLFISGCSRVYCSDGVKGSLSSMNSVETGYKFVNGIEKGIVYGEESPVYIGFKNKGELSIETVSVNGYYSIINTRKNKVVEKIPYRNITLGKVFQSVLPFNTITIKYVIKPEIEISPINVKIFVDYHISGTKNLIQKVKIVDEDVVIHQISESYFDFQSLFIYLIFGSIIFMVFTMTTKNKNAGKMKSLPRKKDDNNKTPKDSADKINQKTEVSSEK